MRAGNRLFPLLGGNLLAQALQIAAIPLLTRLYGPERYGVYGLFAANLLLASTLATLRYEVAIQLPKSDGIAASIAGLAIIVCTGASVLVFLVASVVAPYLSVGLTWSGFALPLAASTLFLGGFNVLNGLALRAGSYKLSAAAKVLQVAGSVAFALLAFWAGHADWGLLYGNVVGHVVGCVVLTAVANRFVSRPQNSTACARAWGAVFRRYRSFAVFNAPQAIMDGLRPVAIVTLIQAAFGSAAAGYYHVAHQLLQTPATVVANAVSQVHFRDLVNSPGEPHLRARLRLTLASLLIIASTGIVLVLLFSKPLVELVFGGAWPGVHLTLESIVLIVATNFVVAPLVFVFHARQRHGEFLRWSVAYNGMAIGAVAIGCSMLSTPNEALLLYSVAASPVLVLLGVRAVKLTVEKVDHTCGPC